MRKFSIVEIENSYLNFFTPAVLIAAGLFLFELFNWPLIFLQWVIYEAGLDVDMNVLGAMLANLTGILVCLVVYFVFIPRLKVKDTQYENPNLQNLLVIAPVFLVIIFVRVIITILFTSSGNTPYLIYPWFMNSYDRLLNPMILLQFILYQFVIIPIYAELLYRRTIIPLLEDRGLSPILAVILSSLGFCLLYLPGYYHPKDSIGTIFWFISTFLFGLATGLIYILTRNVLFSIFYAIIYYAYRLSGDIGTFFQNEFLLTVHYLLSTIILIGGLILLIYVIWSLFFQRKSSVQWVNVIKTTSGSKITRGLIGYFVISVLLVSFQLIVSNLFHAFLPSDMLLIFAANTLFYLIAFSIPFWLSITSEYAQY